MNLKALRAGSHCVGDELCRAGGESCRTGFYFRKKEKHMDTIAAYLIFLNLVGFLIMGEDKRRAKMHRWRISERMLFLVSILGGSIGTWAGMYVEEVRQFGHLLSTPYRCGLKAHRRHKYPYVYL